MNREEITIRKTPFLFLKWLVTIEFFLAVLPFAIATLAHLRQSYDGTVLARTVSYNFLVAIVLTTIQVLIVSISFVAWYLPVYQADKRRVLYRRSNLFEDKELIQTQSIERIEVRQGPLGRRLDYGTLLIYGLDAAKEVPVRDVPNPERYRAEIEGLIILRRPPATPQQAESVQELIAQGEGQRVEFKSSLMWDYRRQAVNKGLYEPVMKNIVAFMNTTGGTLLIGVADDGEILGLEPDYQAMRKPDSDGFENVFNMAFNRIIGVEYRRFLDISFPVLEGKQVCFVTVRPASQPAYLLYKGTEAFYIRAGNGSQALPMSKATSYIREHFER